jgi:hypothetical protein
MTQNTIGVCASCKTVCELARVKRADRRAMRLILR